MPCRCSKAFTLIELLIIIAIIALIAAILFPVFAAAREKARQATCLSNLKQIGLADAMYSQDFDETLVPSYNGPDTSWLQYAGNQRWMDLLFPFVKSAQVFDCPDDSNAKTYYQYNPPGAAHDTPGALISFYAPGSYGINNTYWDGSNEVHPPTSTGDNDDDPVRLVASLQHPSTKVHFADATTSNPNLGGGNAYLPEVAWPNQAGTGGMNANAAVANLNQLTPPVLYDLQFRHTGGANVLFCDGHAKYARPADLLQKNAVGLFSEWFVESNQ